MSKRSLHAQAARALAGANLLGSLFFVPALWGQNVPEESARWESAIQAFEAADKTNPPPARAVLFIGSSSIRLWTNLTQVFPEHRIINRGFGGSHLADSVAFADRIVIPYQPRLILLYAGDNDIAAGKTPERVLADFKTLVQKVRAALPDTRIAYLSIKPSPARRQYVELMRQANRRIADHARTDERLAYIDLFTLMLDAQGEPREELFIQDGLHLNDKGYELWASIVRPHLAAGRRGPKTK
jgi:lysophospholipase L1-like esterase